MGHMQAQCNGRQRCQIRPQVFVLGTDDCPGTNRYLEAHYRCTNSRGEQHEILRKNIS